MKQLVIFVALCAVLSVQGLTGDQKALMKKHSEECISSSGVDRALVKAASTGNIGDDQKLKEYATCFFKKSGVQNDAGKIKDDVLRKKLSADYSESEVSDLLKKCKSDKGTPADVALSFWKCYWENGSKHIPLA